MNSPDVVKRKIVEESLFYDNGTFLKQIGLA
jgi:hypothetical protein